ncbi:hypothetical protein [Streptomyces sp. NPDC002580]|uniref:hypothetical protein n=1 Tax=Streptomyces sp. NPDC002580 TaxID=3364653 RepID=UPI0036B91458
MGTGQACLWGLLGAGLVEMRGVWSAFQPVRVPRWPWRDGRGRPQVWGYVIAVVCRFGMAAGMDAVYAAAHQITGPLAAVTLGITAPLLIQQMAERGGPSPADPPRHPARSGNGHVEGGIRRSDPRMGQRGRDEVGRENAEDDAGGAVRSDTAGEPAGGNDVR